MPSPSKSEVLSKPYSIVAFKQIAIVL